MEAENKLDWFFYLVFGNERSHNFFKMSEVMAKQGITLIPIEYHQLIQFKTDMRLIPTILCVDSLKDKKRCTPKMMAFLKRLVLLKKVALYHFSSFSEQQLNCYTKEAEYHFYPLPINLNKTLNHVIFHQLEVLADSNKWKWSNYLGIR